MIERISQVIDKNDIQDSFPEIKIKEKDIIRYNIGHLKAAFLINNVNPDLLQKHQWGLIPVYSRDGRNSGNLTNARVEQLPSSVSYRIPIREHRCIIPIDSFYLWERKGDKKVPYRFFVENKKVLWVAGLWSGWTNGVMKKMTFSIITAKPQEHNAHIPADRVPVLLGVHEASTWLEPISLSDVMTLLHDRKEPKFQGYKISERINSTNYDSPELHKQELYVPTLFD